MPVVLNIILDIILALFGGDFGDEIKNWFTSEQTVSPIAPSPSQIPDDYWIYPNAIEYSQKIVIRTNGNSNQITRCEVQLIDATLQVRLAVDSTCRHAIFKVRHEVKNSYQSLPYSVTFTFSDGSIQRKDMILALRRS